MNYTVDANRLRELWGQKMPIKDIAKALRLPRLVVAESAERMGLPRRQLHVCRLPHARMEFEYVENKRSAEWIGDLVGCSTQCVLNVLRSRGVAIRPRGSKLNPAEIAALTLTCVQLARAGMTRPEIADKLKLTRQRVAYRVVQVLGRGKHGGARKHAGGPPLTWNREECRQLRAAGKSRLEIADKLGMSVDQVDRRLKDTVKPRAAKACST